MDAAEEDTLLADPYITAFLNLWHLLVFQIWIEAEVSCCKGICMMINSEVWGVFNKAWLHCRNIAV